ncbi:MAG: MFS transporter [Nocardioidaceae bacterium]|nr:MFS transporter [Nocardioidaceae bacterium]
MTDPPDPAAPGGSWVTRGLGATARAARRAGSVTMRTARRAADAQGAGESGLSRLIHMHFFNTAGDAAVAIALAGTLFFTVPSGQARGQVALFLALTMLPFAIVAPLIGPFLDRFAHGRRWAIGATMALRAFLCWVLAGAVVDESVWLFPAALGVLVASKAYGVTRAAAVPRLLPADFTLVKANGRVSMAGIVGVAVSAPLAGLASLAGPEWVLRYAFLLFAAATVGAIRLPPRVDSSQGEGDLLLRDRDRSGARTGSVRIPAAVAYALRANCGPRWMSGFLIMFMAFQLRENPVGGWSTEVLTAVVVGGAAAGNFLGVVAASMLKRIDPAITVTAVLVADVAVVVFGFLLYGVLALALLGLVAGLGQALAKFSLDATIQRDVPHRVQASAFARSDTTLQLAWVIGGFVGIAMPLDPPRLGLGVATAVLVAWAAFVLLRHPARHPARRPAAGPTDGPSVRGRADGATDERGRDRQVETQPLYPDEGRS